MWKMLWNTRVITSYSIHYTKLYEIIGCFLLVRWLSGGTLKSGEKAESMGHVWDENLEELNNPLPSWWLKLFYITLVSYNFV